ncbi:hypothetical protein J14TS5_30530 [Paenibacillus lautus]|nr:hypothetical protein J14TS5_30530 [Paenibacillus lautus]
MIPIYQGKFPFPSYASHVVELIIPDLYIYTKRPNGKAALHLRSDKVALIV